MSSGSESGSWFRPGIADLIFVLVALVVFMPPASWQALIVGAIRGDPVLPARHTLLDDPGVGWHLRNIDAMIAHGGWLTQDPFTDPGDKPPAKWYTNQWLGELPAWVGWKWAGAEGIAVANALILALLARWLYLALVRDGLPWPMAVFWTALGMVGTSCSWNARPNVFSILFVFIAVRILVGLHEGSVSRMKALWLLPLFAAWANVHGGFVAGLMMLAATLVIEVAIAGAAMLRLTGVIGAGAAVHRALFLALLAVGCFLATLVNPYGVDLYRWVFQLLGDPFFMDLHQEWRSPDFHSAGAMRYELLLLLFPAVLAVSDRRPNLVELGLSILWLHLALTGFRYVALWVVVAVPLMARASMAVRALNDLAARLGLSAGPESLFHTPRGRTGWLGSAVAALALIGLARGIEGRIPVHNQEIVASHTLDRLLTVIHTFEKEHGRRPVVFHHYNWGGYLTWHGWPEVLNWIDDRNEVQGKAKIQEYFDVIGARPGWEKTLSRVDLVCIPPETPLARTLGADSSWHQRSDGDSHAVIFERKQPRARVWHGAVDAGAKDDRIRQLPPGPARFAAAPGFPGKQPLLN
jgi:hypothetical protein